MKYIFILLISLSFANIRAQVQNGSFENGIGPDLSFWDWVCGAESIQDAPLGGGQWCIKVNGGNPKSCYPGFAYQRLPTVHDGETYTLSGMAYAQSPSPVGIYFGSIDKGIFTLMAGDTTSSDSWTPLHVKSSFKLAASDTAVVVLSGGFTGGPVQGYGYFDLIDLQQETGIQPIQPDSSFRIYPDPFTDVTTLETDHQLSNATLEIFDPSGQMVKEIRELNGHRVLLARNQLPRGIYFLRLTENDRIIISGKFMIAD